MFYAIFNQHLDLVSGMGAFVCELCGKEFTARSNLSRHQRSHKNETFSCDKCNFSSHTKRSLNEHTDRVHSSVLYPCDQCAKSFTCKQNLKIHAEQEGERLNKELNELEDRLLHIKHKPTRYFQLIRDLENKIYSDKSTFQTNKRKRKLYLIFMHMK